MVFWLPVQGLFEKILKNFKWKGFSPLSTSPVILIFQILKICQEKRQLLRGCCLKADVIPDWENMKPRGSTRLKTGMVLTMKLWSGTAAEARMDETIIFKLFTKKEKTGSLEIVPDALILPGDETERGLPCLLHQHVLGTAAAPQISAALLFGRKNLRDETYSHIWSDTRQFRAASAWSWRIHCLPPSQSVWHSLGEHCSPEKLVFTPSFLFPWFLNSSWLQLPAFSLAGALHFPYNFTAQRDLSSVRLWCCNHCTGQCPGTPARMCSRQKRLFFSKNTKYNRGSSAQELQEHLAGEDGTLLLAGITCP